MEVKQTSKNSLASENEHRKGSEDPGIMESLPIAVYTCDADGYITFYNKAAAALWGREPVLLKDLWCGSWKIFTPDGHELPIENCPMAIALKEKRAVENEVIIVERPDGQRRFIQPTPRPLFDNDGKFIGAVNTLVDITRLKEADKLIQQNELKYRQLVEGLPAAAYMCDTEGRIILYNSAAEELWGNTPGPSTRWCASPKAYDLNGTPLDISQAPLAVAIRENKFIRGQEFVIERSNGTRRNVIPHPQAVYDHNGNLVGAVNMIYDVTEQRDTEAALREREQQYKELVEQLDKKVKERTLVLNHKNEELKRSEERYHKMIDEVQEYAIILLDQDGIIRNWNKGAEKIKGYTEKEIIGKSFNIFYTQEDRDNGLPDKLLGIAKANGRATHEGWRIRKDGTAFWGNISITTIYDEAGNLIGFSKVTRDLTERKLNEDKMADYMAELEFQNRELEQFAFVASHDLQEPLRKIQIISEMLENSLHDREKAEKLLGKIRSSAGRLSLLIKDILNYTRLRKSNDMFVKTNLNNVMKAVTDDLEQLIQQAHATIKVPNLPSIKGLPVQLYQLFSNLISNSIKFCDKEHPLIEISCSEIPKTKIPGHIPVDHSKAYIELTFTDNGIGFDQQYSEQIFKLFQRLHDNKYGTGIGLAMCKRIVENHHGYIYATSEPGQGTTMHVYLPVK